MQYDLNNWTLTAIEHWLNFRTKILVLENMLLICLSISTLSVILCPNIWTLLQIATPSYPAWVQERFLKWSYSCSWEETPYTMQTVLHKSTVNSKTAACLASRLMRCWRARHIGSHSTRSSAYASTFIEHHQCYRRLIIDSFVLFVHQMMLRRHVQGRPS